MNDELSSGEEERTVVGGAHVRGGLGGVAPWSKGRESKGVRQSF